MILLWYNYVIRSTSISLPSARITSTASATIPTCVMFIIDCDFCDFCEKCEFRKSHISHISQFAHYLFRLLFFLYFPCSTFWISLDSVYFVSHRFIVPTLTPRTPACFTASCLVEQSFESVDEIRSPWGAFEILASMFIIPNDSGIHPPPPPVLCSAVVRRVLLAFTLYTIHPTPKNRPNKRIFLHNPK